jgi:receptor expression-enhancing protein 1/2/3/4
LLTVFELFGDRLISWLPLYYEAKIAFVIWLTLPQFRGAAMLYNRVVHGYLVRYESHIDRHISDTALTLQRHATDVGRKSATSVQAVLFMLLQRVTEALAAASRPQAQRPALPAAASAADDSQQ